MSSVNAAAIMSALLGLTGSLVAFNPALASDPCSDPQVANWVQHEVVCTELVKCKRFGGWDALAHGITIEQYAQGIGFDMTRMNKIRWVVLRNGYKMVDGIGSIIDHVDTIPVSYEEKIDRTDCRMTIHWNSQIEKRVIFAGFWTKQIASGPGQVYLLMGPDGGWSFMWRSINFDQRVYDRTTVEYGVVGSKVEIEQTGELFNDQ